MRPMLPWLSACVLASCASSTTSTSTANAGAADTGATADAGSTDGSTGASDTGASADATAPDAGTSAGGCPAQEVPCADNQIQDLSLLKKPSPATVDNEADGDGWSSAIDASGGGMSPTLSYVYAKFTPKGLEKVEVGDQGALESTDWDIAFRRYVIRLNSGVAGPSCVQGGEIKSKAFDDVTAWPDQVKLASEAYYDKACKLVEDDSGLPNAPATVLAKFWTYQSCVQMSGKTWGIQLASGQRLKLTVDGYYEAKAQETCNAKGSVPPGTPGGKIHLRWAYLP